MLVGARGGAARLRGVLRALLDGNTLLPPSLRGLAELEGFIAARPRQFVLEPGGPGRWGVSIVRLQAPQPERPAELAPQPGGAQDAADPAPAEEEPAAGGGAAGTAAVGAPRERAGVEAPPPPSISAAGGRDTSDSPPLLSPTQLLAILEKRPDLKEICTGCPWTSVVEGPKAADKKEQFIDSSSDEENC